MDCASVREALLRGRLSEQDAGVAAHLEACAPCARIARRIAAVRERLRAPAVPVEPDPGFPLRVVARLPQPMEVLGWAALRALPAALLLALALAWVGLSQPPSPANLLAGEPSADLLLTYGTLAPEAGR
jgi:hypothetical protein